MTSLFFAILDFFFFASILIKMIPVIVSILALALAIAALCVALVTKPTTDSNRAPSDNDGNYDLPRQVEAVSKHAVKLDSVPSTIDGVELSEGAVVYLNAQENDEENGFYRVHSSTGWTQIPERDPTLRDGHMVYVRRGDEFGSNLLMLNRGVDSNNTRSTDDTMRRVVVSETATKHVSKTQMANGVIITTTDIVLPDPKDLKFSQEGELRSLKVLNSSEENPIEIGYNSNWSSKCDTTIVEPLTGASIILRNSDGRTAEIYRVS